MTEEIHIVTPNGPSTWSPIAGEEALSAASRKLDDSEAQERLLADAAAVLASCNPHETRTGLVVGYVQSGKTLSFTTVAAMAADNGFQLVIVVAGTTTDLANQSRDRLVEDLGIEESPFSRWHHVHNPGQPDLSSIRNTLSAWTDDSVPAEERRTVLISVLKNHTRLESLCDLLQEIRRDIESVPTLIIDDEADQASLNTLVRRNDLSTTYDRIARLREVVGTHGFLQYTATPQAIILINLIDVLSPDFVRVLEPGDSYVGGSAFFFPGSPFVETIPFRELPDPQNPRADPPDSLLRALRLFFIGVASGRIRRAPSPLNRSMMVHPARERIVAALYYQWVESIQNTWIDLLGMQPNPDRDDLLQEFRNAHAELVQTQADLEPFDAIEPRLTEAIRSTQVRLVNTLPQANRDVKWKRYYSWILVGGQVLDRGFTVEGLTITYMPRGPGVRNADTIQQRARFLGYKRSYQGFCRVLLHPDVEAAYRLYVRHEEDIRSRLERHQSTGQSMRAFRRAFLLDRALRPTRGTVIDVDYVRPVFRDGWCIPRRPHSAPIADNRAAIEAFLRAIEGDLADFPGHPDRKLFHQHRHAEVPLERAYSELLVPTQLTYIEDSQKLTAALMMIDAWLNENPDSHCSIFEMRPRVTARRQVRDGSVVRLLQGAYRLDPSVYAGDREMRDSDVTVQIHRIDLVSGATADSPVVASDVAFPVVWLSDRVMQDVLIQPQD